MKDKNEKQAKTWNTGKSSGVNQVCRDFSGLSHPLRYGIKIIVPIKSEKSLRLVVHISKTLTKSLR
jgi:hypothetical protein